MASEGSRLQPDQNEDSATSDHSVAALRNLESFDGGSEGVILQAILRTKGKLMTEVNEFLALNNDIGSEFRDFLAQHETLRDVWKDCPMWCWMLDLLDRCHYRNAEKVERFIDRQSGHIEDVSDAAIEATRQRYFNYQSGAKQIEAEAEAGTISRTEARRRRFIWARIVAYEASGFILRDKMDRVRFNNACAPIIDAEMDIELPLTDETQVELSVLRRQGDELREILGNPFQFAAANDFGYGDIG